MRSYLMPSEKRIIGIRTDANGAISTGHVMRCLTIADELMERGQLPFFIVSDGASSSLIGERGYEAVVLESDWRNLKSGLAATLSLLLQRDAACILLDTYSATPSYVDAIAELAPVCYLGSKDEYLGRLSALINYSTNVDEGKYDRLYGKQGTRLYLGPSYAPIRPSFVDSARYRDNESHRILLTCGNTDNLCFLEDLLLRLLTDKALDAFEFDVVIGSLFTNKARMSKKFSKNYRIRLHQGLTDLSSIMKDCCFAITANGTTVYELAAAEVPVVSFAISPEQVGSARALSGLGALFYCGEAYEDAHEVREGVAAAAASFAVDSALRRQYANRAHRIIDGEGVFRIAHILESL